MPPDSNPSATSPSAAPDSRGPKSHVVTIHVNDRPVELLDKAQSGAEIKQAAISQGVPIHADFILVEELGGDRTKVIGDDDIVHLTDHSRFLANDGDDNS